MNNKIYIIGAIDEPQYIKFSKKLTAIEGRKPQGACIDLELFSFGGEALTALAICGRMRMSPLKFRIKAVGEVSSAAVMILASGNDRIIEKSTIILVHEDFVSDEPGARVSEKEKTVAALRRAENQWAALLEEKTKASFETWLKLHKDETYLDAQQALNLGLVDKII